MEVKMMIPLIGELLALGFKLTDLIAKSESISDDDKEAMRAEILKAKDGVTFWE
jgi:hypothetical protein